MVNICDSPPSKPENTHPMLSMLPGKSETLIILNDDYIIGRYQSILLPEIDGRGHILDLQIPGLNTTRLIIKG